MKERKKKPVWEREVEFILKEGAFNSRLKEFKEKWGDIDLQDLPAEEWQEAFEGFFQNLLDEYPVLECCIFAFLCGVVWQKYFKED